MTHQQTEPVLTAGQTFPAEAGYTPWCDLSDEDQADWNEKAEGH